MSRWRPLRLDHDHQSLVRILYRRLLRSLYSCMGSWEVHATYQSEIRWEFERCRDMKDPDEIQRLVDHLQKFLINIQHPQPLQHFNRSGGWGGDHGVKFMRNNPCCPMSLMRPTHRHVDWGTGPQFEGGNHTLPRYQFQALAERPMLEPVVDFDRTAIDNVRERDEPPYPKRRLAVGDDGQMGVVFKPGPVVDMKRVWMDPKRSKITGLKEYKVHDDFKPNFDAEYYKMHSHRPEKRIEEMIRKGYVDQEPTLEPSSDEEEEEEKKLV